MSTAAAERKRVVEDFKKGILTEGFDVYHCAPADKYIVRKRKSDQGDPPMEADPVRKKFGDFIC